MLVASAVVVVVVAWALRATEGPAALAKAQEASARGALHEAVVFLRSAAEARCPSCSAPDTALARLDEIAKDSEARGDLATARFALAATRGALLGTTFGTEAARAHVDREIVRLARAADVPSAEHAAEALADPPRPRAVTFALLTAALALLVTAGARVLGAPRVRVVDAALAAGAVGLGALGLVVF